MKKIGKDGRDMLNPKMSKALCGRDLKFVRYGEECDRIRRKNNGVVVN